MLWFRNNYLPNAEDYTKWDSSPIFAPSDLLAKAPKALILVAGLDILRDEGIAYGTKLTQVGVDARVKVYDKAPHQTMALDGTFTYSGPYLCSADINSTCHKSVHRVSLINCV